MKERLIITAKDLTSKGGGERVCVNLASAFVEHFHNFEIHIISFYKGFEKSSFKLDERVKTHYIYPKKEPKNPFLKAFHKSIFRLYLSFKAHKLILNLKPNFVLANDGFFIPFLRLKNALYFRLWHLHAPRKKSKKFALFDTLIILSHKELKLWQSYHQNVVVIPNFLPTIPCISTNLSQKVILTIGRMDRGDVKGFSRLLDIYALLAKDESFKSEFKGWRAVFVGDGILKEELEAKVRALNLSDFVVFKPFTPEIEKEYLAASIYALSSHFEGFGMVLAEASSYGLACLSFDIKGGVSDIITEGQSGFLVKNNDLKSFAEKLKLLMKDENLRKMLAKNAKEAMRAKFSQEAILKKWQELFKLA